MGSKRKQKAAGRLSDTTVAQERKDQLERKQAARIEQKQINHEQQSAHEKAHNGIAWNSPNHMPMPNHANVEPNDQQSDENGNTVNENKATPTSVSQVATSAFGSVSGVQYAHTSVTSSDPLKTPNC